MPKTKRKLKALWERQQEERKLFGNSYNPEYIGYVYVDEIGNLLKPKLDNGLFGGQPQLSGFSDGQPAEQNEQIKESCQLAADSSQGLSNGAIH